MGAEGVRLERIALISQAKGQRSVPNYHWAFFVYFQSQAIPKYGLTLFFSCG